MKSKILGLTLFTITLAAVVYYPSLMAKNADADQLLFIIEPVQEPLHMSKKGDVSSWCLTP